MSELSANLGKLSVNIAKLPASANMASVWNCKFKHSGLSAGLAGGRGVIL